MSVKAIARIWELDLPHSEAWVLMAFADHADHEGRNIYPGIGLIAWKTGYSPRQVQRILNALLAVGILVLDDVNYGPYGTNRYHIDWSAARPKPARFRSLSNNLSDDSEPPPTDSQPTVNRSLPDTLSPPSATNASADDCIIEPQRDISEQSGDIAMSPNPLINRPINRQEEPESVTPVKMTLDASQFHPCQHPGCGVMLHYSTSFHGYCRDHRKRSPTPIYPTRR
jgi:hypothetical protein